MRVPAGSVISPGNWDSVPRAFEHAPRRTTIAIIPLITFMPSTERLYALSHGNVDGTGCPMVQKIDLPGADRALKIIRMPHITCKCLRK